VVEPQNLRSLHIPLRCCPGSPQLIKQCDFLWRQH
jgi:hypothetical protein